MIRFNPYISLSILMIFCWSCIDEINLDINTEQRSVVIEGLITDSLDIQEVTVSLSSVIGIGNDNILTPVSNATVKLQDDLGNEFEYSEDGNGKYLLEKAADRGVMYNIEVTLPDGEVYKSIPAAVSVASSIDSVGWAVVDESTRNNAGELVERVNMKLNAFTKFETDARPYLRWRVKGIYELVEGAPGLLFPLRCYITNLIDLNKIRIFDSNELNGNELFDQTLVETKYDYRFFNNFAFIFSQYSITKEEYDYWNNIDQLLNVDGSLFDSPPGTIIGNIYNVNDPNDIAVGYFSVASVSRYIYFINRNVTTAPVDSYCTTFSFRPNGFGCDDCTVLINSTRDKPDFWVD